MSFTFLTRVIIPLPNYLANVPIVPGLCPLADIALGIYPVEIFNLNYTSSSRIDENVGYLTYELVNRDTGPGPVNQSAPMQLNNKGGYAVPLFGYAQLSDATPMAFNDHNRLGVPTTTDKAVGDLRASGATYGKWHICDINSGMVYSSLVWATGDTAPSLSSCAKVDIVRVFV